MQLPSRPHPALLVLAAATLAAAAGCGDPMSGSGYPLATFVCDAQLEVGVPALFDASASRDQGQLEEFTFNFGDGTPILASRSPQVSHTYLAAGPYRVEVEAIDNVRNVAFERRTVQVVAQGTVTACSVGSCPGHLRCVQRRCRFTPAECRGEEAGDYGCSAGRVCCHGYCEDSCS